MFRFSNNVRKWNYEHAENHTWNFKPGAMKARQVKKMKEKALTTTNYVAIASTLQKIQNDVATEGNLPPQETIVRSFKRHKKTCKCTSAHTASKRFWNSWSVEGFCCFGQQKRLTRNVLQIFFTRDACFPWWFDDGTFKQCLDMFY